MRMVIDVAPARGPLLSGMKVVNLQIDDSDHVI